MKVPAEPVIFMKATSAVCGSDDNIVIPLGSMKTDWEVELNVVIGAPANHVSEETALSHVAGYCVINDVSERAFQLEGTGQWTKGKSADTFRPIGPWLVTADEITDPKNLDMWSCKRECCLPDSHPYDRWKTAAGPDVDQGSFLERVRLLCNGNILRLLLDFHKERDPPISAVCP